MTDHGLVYVQVYIHICIVRCIQTSIALVHQMSYQRTCADAYTYPCSSAYIRIAQYIATNISRIISTYAHPHMQTYIPACIPSHAGVHTLMRTHAYAHLMWLTMHPGIPPWGKRIRLNPGSFAPLTVPTYGIRR